MTNEDIDDEIVGLRLLADSLDADARGHEGQGWPGTAGRARAGADAARWKADALTATLKPQGVEARPPGHCDDDKAWAEFVRQYAGQPRSRPDLTDFALANAIFMADRNDFDLIVYQTAAKERIRWLSIRLAEALAHPQAVADEKAAYQQGWNDREADIIERAERIAPQAVADAPSQTDVVFPDKVGNTPTRNVLRAACDMLAELNERTKYHDVDVIIGKLAALSQPSQTSGEDVERVAQIIRDVIYEIGGSGILAELSVYDAARKIAALSTQPSPTQAHIWIEKFGRTCCASCGYVRNATSDARPCKGPVAVELRSPTQAVGDVANLTQRLEWATGMLRVIANAATDLGDAKAYAKAGLDLAEQNVDALIAAGNEGAILPPNPEEA